MQLFVLVFEKLFSIQISKQLAKELMTIIEPSDYIIDYPNTFMHNFCNSAIFSNEFRFPTSFLLSFIPKYNNIIAVNYNLKRPNYTDKHKEFFNMVYLKRDQLHKLTLNDWGEISYTSAHINNLFFPKSEFIILEEMYLTSKIVGFCIGHTGTVLTLFVNTKEQLQEAYDYLFNKITFDNYFLYRWAV